MKIRIRFLVFLQGFLALNLLWFLFALALNTKVLPSPVTVYLHLGKLITDGVFIHILASLFRVVVGLFLALALGMPLGLLMARSKTWDRLLHPLVYLAYPVPKTALLPVVMLFLGLGDSTKISVIALIVVFQVIVTARDAARNIPCETYNYIRSLGASGLQAFLHVTLPAILPELFTNTKVSVGTALSVLFFTEGYGTNLGLGYYIMDSWQRIDYTGMYLGILAIALLGFALFAALDTVESSICRWKERGGV